MDLNTPELTRIFRDELEERSGRLVAGAIALRHDELEDGRLQDLIRDAHTIKGSAGLLGYHEIKEVASRLEHLWKQIGEGYRPPDDVVVAMEASSGRLLPSLDADDIELALIADKLIPGERAEEPTEGTVWSPPAEVIPLRRPEPGSSAGSSPRFRTRCSAARPVSIPGSCTG